MLGKGALQHRKGILQDSAARCSAIPFCAHKYHEGSHGQFEAEGKAKKVEVRSDCVHPIEILKAALGQALFRLPGPQCQVQARRWVISLNLVVCGLSPRQTKATSYRRKNGGRQVRLTVLVMAMEYIEILRGAQLVLGYLELSTSARQSRVLTRLLTPGHGSSWTALSQL